MTKVKALTYNLTKSKDRIFEKEDNQKLILNAVKNHKRLRFKDLQKILCNEMSKQTLSANLKELVESNKLEREYDDRLDGVVYLLKGNKESDIS